MIGRCGGGWFRRSFLYLFRLRYTIKKGVIISNLCSTCIMKTHKLVKRRCALIRISLNYEYGKMDYMPIWNWKETTDNISPRAPLTNEKTVYIKISVLWFSPFKTNPINFAFNKYIEKRIYKIIKYLIMKLLPFEILTAIDISWQDGVQEKGHKI